ncbi:MAG: hypothetical protein GY854_01095 [Deltaproteobacteria bacterium]|nr:hypothetical protein [Deltaproteobacteria bacterium]
MMFVRHTRYFKKNHMLHVSSLLVFFMGIGEVQANAYAPFWDCEGLSIGDECGGDDDYWCCCCEWETNCKNDPATDVNECLVCTGCKDDYHGNGGGGDSSEDCSVVSAGRSTPGYLLALVMLGIGLAAAKAARRKP